MASKPGSPQKGPIRRVLIDTWSTKEKLALACLVAKHGKDGNCYNSASRLLKPFAEPNRPEDWFSSKNCALQYAEMRDKIETPKRSKRGEPGDTLAEDLIVQKLRAERIEELKSILTKELEEWRKLKADRALLNAGKLDDVKVEEYKKIMEDEKQAEITAKEEHEKWLKEREAKFAAAQRPRVSIPSRTKVAATPTPVTPIKAESEASQDSSTNDSLAIDVNAAQGIDAQKTATAVPVPSTSPLLTSLLQSPSAAEKVRSPSVQAITPATSPTKNVPESLEVSGRIDQGDIEAGKDLNEEVKTEISPTSPTTGKETQEDEATKVKETESLLKIQEKVEEKQVEKEPPKSPIKADKKGEVVVAEPPKTPSKEKTAPEPPKTRSLRETPARAASARTDSESDKESRTTKISESSTTAKEPLTDRTGKEEKHPVEPAVEKVSSPVKKEVELDESEQPSLRKRRSRNTQPPPEGRRTSGRVRAQKEKDPSDSQDTPTAPADQKLQQQEATKKSEPETHEAIISEESMDAKTGLRTPSISESIPNSPASSTAFHDDPESHKEYLKWKKAILIQWRAATAHKHASAFMHPVKSTDAEGYNDIVHRPMDFNTIRKRIDNGTIRSTAEFQRDVLLMLQNAIMFNRPNHEIHKMAKEMQEELIKSIEDFVETQKAASQPSSEQTPIIKVRPRERRGAGSTSASNSNTPRNGTAPSTPAPPEEKEQPAPTGPGRRKRTSTDTEPAANTPAPTPAPTTKSTKKRNTKN